MAAIMSSMAIQLMYWSPWPKRRGKPAARVASSRCRAPPRGLSTTPMRRNTVRMPASAAGLAACSQSEQTSEMKSWPGASSSRMQQSRQLP